MGNQENSRIGEMKVTRTMMENPDEYRKMAEVEEEMWWFRILHYQTERVIQSCFSTKDVRILDAGCGSGGLLNYLRQNGYQNVKGFDVSEFGLEFCRQKGLDVDKGNVIEVDRFAEPGSLDVIVCNDVFCYLTLKERRETIDKFLKLLKEDGLVIMNNPSLKAYRGKHDVAVGVNHRFDRSEVLELFNPARFNKISARYWPFFLSPVILFIRTWQRLTFTGDHSALESDVKLPAKWLNAILEKITLMELQSLKTTFTGSSFFVAMQRNGR